MKKMKKFTSSTAFKLNDILEESTPKHNDDYYSYAAAATAAVMPPKSQLRSTLNAEYSKLKTSSSQSALPQSSFFQKQKKVAPTTSRTGRI